MIDPSKDAETLIGFANMTEEAFIIGPNGQFARLEGPRGTTPECPEAAFKVNETVRIRRLKHLRDLPEIGAVVAVIPPGFSPDWAWDDLCKRPRRLLHQTPKRHVQYIVAFEGDQAPLLMREKSLQKTDLPPAEVRFAE